MHVGYPAHPQGSHEEADTLLAFHVSSIAGNAVIRASDTDVFVILLGMIGRHLKSQRPTAYSCIIMDCGSGNIRRHIDVNSIANALEAKQKGLAAAMPGSHVFTGSDFTTALYRNVKLSHEKFLRKTQNEHLSSSSAELFLKICQTRVKQKSSPVSCMA